MLSYGLDGIRRALYWNNPAVSNLLPSWSACLAISLASATILYGIASIIASARSKADLY